MYVAHALSTLLKLITIRILPNGKYVYYYAPNEYVYGWTIFIACVGIIVIFISFLVLFIKIYKQVPSQRHSPENRLQKNNGIGNL